MNSVVNHNRVYRLLLGDQLRLLHCMLNKSYINHAVTHPVSDTQYQI
jgi:hypothetical protein